MCLEGKLAEKKEQEFTGRKTNLDHPVKKATRGLMLFSAYQFIVKKELSYGGQ